MNVFIKIILSSILLFSGCSIVFASHQLGSSFYYEYVGPGSEPNSKIFQVTLISYFGCLGGTTETERFTVIPINLSESTDYYSGIDSVFKIEVLPPDCLTSPLDDCYTIEIYSEMITLFEEEGHYAILNQNCCRNSSINNIVEPTGKGMINYIEITPFAYSLSNSSPVFNNYNVLNFCVDEPVNYSLDVTEIDGDQLVYKFCNPLGKHEWDTLETLNPPYPTLEYIQPTYSVNQPLGPGGLFIDSNTGELSGTPEIIGEFVVAICVEEYNNGVFLGSSRQDMKVNVVECTPLFEASVAADTIDMDGRYVLNLCNESSITITNQSAPLDFIEKYLWEINIDDQVISSVEEHPTFVFQNPGIYEGLLILNPEEECGDTLDFAINVMEIEAAFLVDYDTCNASPISFLDDSFFANTDIDYYLWDFGDSTISNTKSPKHLYLKSGSYPVSLIVAETNTCADTVAQTINWQPAPRIILVSPENAIGCPPLQTFITNRSIPVDSSYQLLWDFGDGNTANGLNVYNQFESPGYYDIYLSITSPLGCFVDTVFEQLIFVDSAQVTNFSWSPEKINIDREVMFIDESQHVIQWNWSFPNENVFNFHQHPFHTFIDTGLQVVTLTTEDQYGCLDSISKMIDVEPITTYFLPNAFTPNQDGLNDVFIGTGLTSYIKAFKLDVFDRWGQLVFQSYDPSLGWNGRFRNRGGMLSHGVYVYHLTYTSVRGKSVTKRGNVVLVK